MVRKARPDADRHREVIHELQVACYLAVAFIAQSHGIGIDDARKKYAHLPVGSFWIDIARQVIANTSKRTAQPDFGVTIH
jgi:hypothetical protein